MGGGDRLKKAEELTAEVAESAEDRSCGDGACHLFGITHSYAANRLTLRQHRLCLGDELVGSTAFSRFN